MVSDLLEGGAIDHQILERPNFSIEPAPVCPPGAATSYDIPTRRGLGTADRKSRSARAGINPHGNTFDGDDIEGRELDVTDEAPQNRHLQRQRRQWTPACSAAVAWSDIARHSVPTGDQNTG